MGMKQEGCIFVEKIRLDVMVIVFPVLSRKLPCFVIVISTAFFQWVPTKERWRRKKTANGPGMDRAVT